jgi:hypothetical protein
MIDVRLGGRRLRSPIEAPFDPRTIRFLQSPVLTLGNHRYRRKHDPAILEPFHAQGLPCIALAEGYLPASPDSLDFCIPDVELRIHAIMLSCLPARCKALGEVTGNRWQGTEQDRSQVTGYGGQGVGKSEIQEESISTGDRGQKSMKPGLRPDFRPRVGVTRQGSKRIRISGT